MSSLITIEGVVYTRKLGKLIRLGRNTITPKKDLPTNKPAIKVEVKPPVTVKVKSSKRISYKLSTLENVSHIKKVKKKDLRSIETLLEKGGSIRDLREMIGLTAEDVVERADHKLSLSGLSSIELGGSVEPSIQICASLARAHNVSLDTIYLFLMNRDSVSSFVYERRCVTKIK